MASGGTVSARRTPSAPGPLLCADLEVTLHHGIGPAPKAAGIAPLCGHRARNEVVSEATARSASHNALHHVDVCPVVDVLAVRPLKVRNGGLSKRCGHIGELVAAVRGMSLQGAKEARATIIKPGFLSAPVEAESLRPDILAAPKSCFEL